MKGKDLAKLGFMYYFRCTRMNPLLQRLNADRKAFERIKKQLESKVVRWEYWEWPRWHWEPGSFLEMGPQRARKGKAQFGYGRDKHDRVVVAHEFDVADPCKVTAMNFLCKGGLSPGGHVQRGAKPWGSDLNI
jgi:hypothetical protein